MRRLRTSLPDRDLDREVGRRARRPGPQRRHHLRLLRGRVLVPRRGQGRHGCAHGPAQGRQGEPRPFVRQGTLRVGLRQSPGPHHNPDGARIHRRPLARSGVAGSHRLCREPPQGHPGQVRAQVHRRNHLVALHQRGGLGGAEDGARRIRQQQRRHLRPRLPLPHRLRTQADLRHVGRHAELRFRRACRRDRRNRGQPDGRPSGVRFAHEEAASPRREADHLRPAQDRPRADSAHRGRPPSATQAGHQRAADERIRARRGHGGPDRPRLRQ